MMINKQRVYKKVLLLTVICLSNTLVWPNEIKKSIQELDDEIVPQYMRILEQQRRTIKNISTYTWYEMFFTDKEREEQREAMRQDPQIRQTFQDFFTLNAPALAILSCKECLDAIDNPNARDLDKCRIEWLASSSRAYALWVAEDNERVFKIDDHEFTNLFHDGNRLIEKRINKIIGENSQDLKN